MVLEVKNEDLRGVSRKEWERESDELSGNQSMQRDALQNLESIIDDGLFIYGNSILRGLRRNVRVQR